jgi:hypothetical protein
MRSSMGADQAWDRGVTGSPAQQATMRLSRSPRPGESGAAQNHVIASSTPACGRPALDETTAKACGGVISAPPSATGRCAMVLGSPIASWTRGASKTPTGAKGGNAWEHAC